MNEKFTNETKRDEEAIARKLNQAAEGTHVSGQFAAELEERLREAHSPRAGWFASFTQISPTLRWVALMILLAVVLSWSIKTLIPAPQPAIDIRPVQPVITTSTPEPNILPDGSATPGLQESEYDFRGAKLLLNQSLPESPEKAHVYLLNREDTPATQEQARALAERFGIQGEVYTTPGFIFDTDDYVISDGIQSLQVHSDKYFSYTSNMARSNRPYPAPTNPDAEAIIRDFLTTRGFDFPFRVYPSFFTNGYVVQPLAPDTIPLQYESFSQPMMRVVLDEKGQVLTIDASLMDYDQNAIGEYGIIPAQEALQKVLDDSRPYGKTETFNAPDHTPQEWYREYPDNQPLTMYGYLSSDPSIDAGKPALITINGVLVVGNTGGMEQLDRATFVRANGQFSVENGIRRFNVVSWDRQIQEAYVSGTLHRDGDQLILTNDDGSGTQYPLIDAPADLPLDTKTKTPDSLLAVSGVIVSGKMDWTYIQYFGSFVGGGGGGGNGMGFYKLNLTGTPVPFESPTLQAPPGDRPVGLHTIKEGDTLSLIAQTYGTTVDELMQLNNLTDSSIFVGQTLYVPMDNLPDQPIENLRGFLTISLHNKSDGTSSKEYNLDVAQGDGASLYPLEGPQLGELDAYNGLPIIVSGTVSGKTGSLLVDSYQVPFPDLRFQVLKGTQKTEQLEGKTVVTFTTQDGTSYVEYLVTNDQPNTTSFTGYQGDLIQEEVLIVPDETFAGLPVAHVYQTSIIQENGPEMEILGNRITVIDEGSDSNAVPDLIQPNLIIEKVELVYFVSNPYYQRNSPDYNDRPPYIQPVWHFEGQYEDGTQCDILIQALKPEFLLPDLAPGITPG